VRQFTVLLEGRARRELDRLREEGRAPGLDDAVGKVLDRLERFPESGPPDWYRGRWSLVRRKVLLGRTDYVLRYRLHLRAELIEVVSIQHQAQRPPRSARTRPPML
jgi:plasmid stabilization system protein ParE